MSHFPLELTTGLYIRLWFSNLESILKKIISLGNQDEEIMDQYQYHNIMKLRPETKTKLNPETAKRYETNEICKTTEMIKTKRLERNEPNNQKKTTETTKIVYQKKFIKIKRMPWGVRRQLSYSSRLDYGLLLIYLTGKFNYLSITISLTWGVEETILKTKSLKNLPT